MKYTQKGPFLGWLRKSEKLVVFNWHKLILRWTHLINFLYHLQEKHFNFHKQLLKTKLIRFFVCLCTKNKKVSDKHFPSNYTHAIQTLTKL